MLALRTGSAFRRIAVYGGARALSTGVTYAPHYQGEKDVSKMLAGMDMIVCDMAGTTIEEGGIVYKTLRKVMTDDGLSVSETEMHPWHGAKKEAVIAHFAEAQGTPPGPELEERVTRCSNKFEEEIEDAYFSPDAPVSLIHPSLMEWISGLQANGCKVSSTRDTLLDSGGSPR